MSPQLTESLYLGAGLWCLVHFALYAAILRRRPAAVGERWIFTYHLASFLIYGASAALVLWLWSPSGSATLWLGVLSVHGIYSMSFLELWSLAQGSYSISILAGLRRSGMLSHSAVVTRFVAIGDEKKGSRVAGLVALGLVRINGDTLSLTAPGRAASTLLALIRWMPNLKQTG